MDEHLPGTYGGQQLVFKARKLLRPTLASTKGCLHGHQDTKFYPGNDFSCEEQFLSSTQKYTGQPPRDKTRHVMNGCDTSQVGGITWRGLGSTDED